MTTRLLVAGGGITGLAAAWQAGRDGAQVVLAEAGPRLGGKVRTERPDDFVIEHGPDSFVTYRPAALRLIEELGATEQVIGIGADRAVHVRVGGRLHPLPEGMGTVLPDRLRPFVTTRILSPAQKLRAGADLALPRHLGTDDVSLGAFLRGRLGDGLVDRLVDPLVGGIYGAGVDSLSLDAVMPTLRASEREHRSLMLASAALGRERRRRSGDQPAAPFRSLADGLGSLTELLTASLLGAGTQLRTGLALVGLEPAGGRTIARFADGTTETFDAVVLAMGPAQLATLLAEHARPAANALRCIPTTTTTVVTLAFPLAAFDAPPTGHGWLEAGPAPVSGVTISSNKFAGRAPADFVLLRAFVPDRLGPLATSSDVAVRTSVTAHVAAVMGIHAEPTLVRVTRWQDAMPVYSVGHRSRVAAVEAALARFPGWQAAGAALHGVGLPDCIADGRRAAHEALASLGS